MMDIIKSEAALDAKAPLIGRPIYPFNKLHFIVFNLQADLTADTAEGAYTVHLPVIILAIAGLILIKHSGRH